MRLAKCFVWALLISMVVDIGLAQQIAPTAPNNPGGGDLRVLPQQPTIPAPSPDPSDQIPQPAGEPLPLPGLSLAELEGMALRCNPTLVQAASSIEAARGRWVQAGLYPNPVAGYIGAENRHRRTWHDRR